MSKEENKPKRDFVTIDDVEYFIDEMDDNQKGMVIHIQDLNEKMAHNEFLQTQLKFAHQAFVNALKESFLVEVIDD